MSTPTVRCNTCGEIISVCEAEASSMLKFAHVWVKTTKSKELRHVNVLDGMVVRQW